MQVSHSVCLFLCLSLLLPLLQEDDDGPLGAPDYDTISENGLLSRNEPIRSKVSKLTEKLRKRYPTTSTGNCSSCNAVFSVLKKRRNCSNCGNSFCSRCCSFKVLRSCMGATAPEAQRETVFVCAACNSSLVKLQWDGMSVSSLPWALQQVTETLTHDLVFNLGRSYLLRYLPYWTPRPSLPFPVASLLSCLCCFWDFYCNMFDISFFNSQWRTGP